MMRAFSLAEAILVCALLGILTALVVPSLGSVRLDARRAVSLTQLRQHATVFGAYEADQRGYLPFFTDPRATLSIVRNRSAGFAVAVPYFGAHTAWNIALADEYYNGDHLSPIFQSPTDPRPAGAFAGYWYTCTALAGPRYWNLTTREGPSQLGAVRADQATFPSSKGVLLDAASWHADAVQTPRSPVALLDASARSPRPDEFGVAYPSGESPAPGAIHGTWFPPIHHTVNGVQGRDLP